MGCSIAPDPVWQAHSPINIKNPSFKQKQIGGMPMETALKNPATLKAYMEGNAQVTEVELPVTAQVKNDVMTKWSNPLQKGSKLHSAYVLLDPLSDLVGRLMELLEQGEGSMV